MFPIAWSNGKPLSQTKQFNCITWSTYLRWCFGLLMVIVSIYFLGVFDEIFPSLWFVDHMANGLLDKFFPFSLWLSKTIDKLCFKTTFKHFTLVKKPYLTHPYPFLWLWFLYLKVYLWISFIQHHLIVLWPWSIRSWDTLRPE